MEKVVLVDENDKKIGLIEKEEAHLGEGKLHRAFTSFVFNKKGEALIAKRSKGKMLWPLVWDSACASHPRKGESYEEATERRLKEELGFSCQTKRVDNFLYHVAYRDIGFEYEYCVNMIGNYDGKVDHVKDEVEEWKWISIEDLRRNMEKDPDSYTPWLKIALDRMIEKALL